MPPEEDDYLAGVNQSSVHLLVLAQALALAQVHVHVPTEMHLYVYGGQGFDLVCGQRTTRALAGVC